MHPDSPGNRRTSGSREKNVKWHILADCNCGNSSPAAGKTGDRERVDSSARSHSREVVREPAQWQSHRPAVAEHRKAGQDVSGQGVWPISTALLTLAAF